MPFILKMTVTYLTSTIMRTDTLLNATVGKLDQEKSGMDLVLKEVGITTQGEWEMAGEEVAWCLHIQGTDPTPFSQFPAEVSKLWLCLGSAIVSVWASHCCVDSSADRSESLFSCVILSLFRDLNSWVIRDRTMFFLPVHQEFRYHNLTLL